MTTIDKIKAEIEQIADEEQKHDEKWAIGLRYAVKILDKYAEQKPKVTTTSTDEPMVIQYPQVDGITPTVIKAEQEPYVDMTIAYLMGYYADKEPCDDAISRQAVDELSKELVHTTRDKADFLCNFWEGLQKLPSVRPQEQMGHWIEHEIKDTCRWLTCSVCGYEWVNKKENFCPNCGAKMVEPQESEKINGSIFRR